MYLFFETKTSTTMKGDIGVAESSDQGVTWKYMGIALEEEWHLSYPYVFEYDGEVINCHRNPFIQTIELFPLSFNKFLPFLVLVELSSIFSRYSDSGIHDA